MNDSFRPVALLNDLMHKSKFQPQIEMIFRILKNKPDGVAYKVRDNYYFIIENNEEKVVIGSDYNYMFNKINGSFARWGTTTEQDAQFSPIGPEIADIEISVDGCSGGCPWCYKDNTNQQSKNMSLDTFKQILSKLPRTLNQIAFGITDLDSNVDFMRILCHTRSEGIIPNFTTHGVGFNEYYAHECSSVCGAIAVSCYEWNKEECYNTVKLLTDKGMKQINIHLVVGDKLFDHAFSVIQDIKNDKRLEKLNALVFLGMKPKGRAVVNQHSSLDIDKYKMLIDECMKNSINYGFDSCSAHRFENCLKTMNVSELTKKNMLMASEGCESDLFSTYINVDGLNWPCSFSEDVPGYTGVDIINCHDFLDDVWYSPSVLDFRNRCIVSGKIDNCRKCVVFPQINMEPIK